MNEIIELRSLDAISLWQKGKDVWNQWVAEHPDADIIFDNIDLFSYANKNGLSFAGYNFPDGKVNFNFVEFGDCSVSFFKAHFGNSDVSFIKPRIGNGSLDFHDATFGKGSFTFQMDCSNCSVNFANTIFSERKVNFGGTKFGCVNFTNARFNGDVSFVGTDFCTSNVNFEGVNCKGNFRFEPRSIERCETINFSSISVDGALSFGAFKTCSVIDLRHSYLKHPIDLDKVDINFLQEDKVSGTWPKYRKAINKEDSACFRRLKKLAKDADDHERRLDFFAKEIRSSYGHSLSGGMLFMYLLYDNISDYGRSLKSPIGWLFATFIVCGLFYFNLSAYHTPNRVDGLYNVTAVP